MKIKLTKNHLRKMVNEAIDEFKNASTERFNTDPIYRNMIDVNSIEDDDEFFDALDNQYDPEYAKANGYDDVADKWEEREKKYPEGFVRDQFGNWIDDGDYYEDGELPKDHWRRTGEFPSGHMNGEFVNESRRKNKVRLTDKNVVKINNGDLRKMISEAVRKYVNDGHGIDLSTGNPLGQDYYDKENERAPRELKGRCALTMRRLSETIGNLGIMMSHCDDDWTKELRNAESHLQEAYHTILNIYKQIDGDEYINGEPLSDDRGW